MLPTLLPSLLTHAPAPRVPSTSRAGQRGHLRQPYVTGSSRLGRRMLSGIGFLQDLEQAESLKCWDMTCRLVGILGGGKKKKKKSGNGTQLKEPVEGASVLQSKCFHSLVSPLRSSELGGSDPPFLEPNGTTLEGMLGGLWPQSKHR